MPEPLKSKMMAKALEEAHQAALRGEVPVGAIVVNKQGKIVGNAGNRTEELSDPTAHAEILAIRMATKAAGSARLPECDLYVTLEPCAMCAAAISFARIARVFYGAADPKGGAVDNGTCFFSQPTCHHKPEVWGGIEEEASANLLKNFFTDKRQ